MVFLLKQIFGFVKLLNSETGHIQIAAGIACGLILGFAPVFSLQTLLVIFLLFFFSLPNLSKLLIKLNIPHFNLL